MTTRHSSSTRISLESNISQDKNSPVAAGPLSRTWIAVFVLGFVNNFAYVVVISSAKSICAELKQPSLIGLIQWANVALGLISRWANAFLFTKISYSARIYAVALGFILSLLCISFALSIGSFVLAIFSILVMGSMSALGESVCIAHLQSLSSNLTGSWSSGTGMAGVGGALFYLLLSSILHVSNKIVFLSMAALFIFYAFAFFLTKLDPIYKPQETKGAMLIKSSTDGFAAYEALGHDDIKEKGWDRFRRVGNMISYLIVNIGLVYFLEYVISVGFAANANRKVTLDDVTGKRKRWTLENSYVILALCYQIGVFISRSSLSILKIRRIWILNVFQSLNFVLWLLQCYRPFLHIYVQIASMIFVGLLGGTIYVNVFYLLVSGMTGSSTSQSLPMSSLDKDLAINMAAAASLVGIMLSSIFEIAFDRLLG